jgi:hypothetical protein
MTERYSDAAARAWLAGAFGGDGRRYVPLAEAARIMGVSEARVEEMASAGILHARRVGDRIEVEPAILSGPGATA